MSRDTIHTYMETMAADVLSPAQKDALLGAAYTSVAAAFYPWGVQHLAGLIAYSYIDMVAGQTDYDFPADANGAPSVTDILGVDILSQTGTYLPAQKVAPFVIPPNTWRAWINFRNVYFIDRGKLVIPYNQQTATDGMRLRVMNRPTMTSATTNTGLSQEAESVWALRALENYYTGTGNGNEALAKHAQAQQIINDLKQLTPVADG